MSFTETSFHPAFKRLVRHRERCVRCRERWERALRAWDLQRERDDEVGNGIAYGALLTPLGMLWVASDGESLWRVAVDEDEAAFCAALPGSPRYAPGEMQAVLTAFDRYFAGEPLPALRVHLAPLTRFAHDVLEVVHAIPRGMVASYGEIAAAVGAPRAARAVGGVVGANPITIVIPCHRVVRSDRTLGQYASDGLGSCGAYIKEALLTLEGTQFIDSSADPSAMKIRAESE